MTTGGFIQNYTTNPNGPIGFERDRCLVAVAFAAAMWFCSTLLSPATSRTGSGASAPT